MGTFVGSTLFCLDFSFELAATSSPAAAAPAVSSPLIAVLRETIPFREFRGAPSLEFKLPILLFYT